MTGRAGRDDFGTNGENHLVVSERALAILRRFGLDGCTIYDAEAAPTARRVEDDLWAEARKVAQELRRARGLPERP